MARIPSLGPLLIGVGSIMTSMTVVGFALGYAVDRWLDSQPVGLLTLGFLGILGGLMKAHRLLIHPDLNNRCERRHRQ